VLFITTLILNDLFKTSRLELRLGIKLVEETISSTFFLVLGLTPSFPLITKETTVGDTPAILAISLIVRRDIVITFPISSLRLIISQTGVEQQEALFKVKRFVCSKIVY
jgi:hypothetical protein